MNSDLDSLPPPPSGFKYMECRYCEKPMVVGIRRRKQPAHIECGVQAAIDNSRQMANKSGPNYDRWKESMARRFGN